ncbi:MAG: ribosome biogenesis GTPase Der [Firmicutes bacterium]|nr:ribosome biogenesis GTPase Der [Bacillota bacterium]MBQ6842106.1 ribosome biogenesis GTPase Der [Bacillota bacterium]MBR6824478.1 ribosome biogenesis GTPase Der [Bacillota bacterium]MBR7114294.1 ribosome biogenesis GTPase Der [Bacillota bacterium]
MKPTVAIVGRENVGKSTLFNRIIGSRDAIVQDLPGVTRDRLYRDAEWLNHEFTLIDTGGIKFNTDAGVIAGKVKQQAELAIEEAQVIIFVVSYQDGMTADDDDVAKLLLRSGKPVVLAVNKVDNFSTDISAMYEFYSLGLGDPIPLSASQALNIGDLLDAVIAHFPKAGEYDDEGDVVKLALIGRPNVGKSSLTNRLLGQERVIVSDVPGTTRDAIDTRLKRGDKEYLIIDTAGMRRKNRVNEPTEFYSVSRSMNAIDRCDVAVLVIDASAGIIEQDKHIAGYAHEAGKGLLIVVNKWDLPEKDEKTMNKFEKQIKEELGFASYALTIFVSAKTGQRCDKILPLVDFISEQATRRIPTARFNEVLRDAVAINPPPTDKGRRLKILYGTQVGVQPPKLVVFLNDPEIMHFSYARYLENKIREAFGFAGTPISLIWRKREKSED